MPIVVGADRSYKADTLIQGEKISTIGRRISSWS